MTIRTSTLLAMFALLLARSVEAETVYRFVALCNQESLGHCFSRIDARLADLSTGNGRRICLPPSFGAMLSRTTPVSLLEQVRVRLSAARFGDASSEVDDVIVRIVNDIYPCDPTLARRRPGGERRAGDKRN